MVAEAESVDSNQDDQSTPLHRAVETEEIEVIRQLCREDPNQVLAMDSVYQRPLDIVCGKIIMHEELNRYAHLEKHQDRSTALWEISRILLAAQDRLPQNEPILHCIAHVGSTCPISLRDRAFTRHASQLEQFDDSGQIPIHIACSCLPDDAADGDDDVLVEIVRRRPATVRIKNQNNQFPFEIALEHGRTWRTGLSLLFEAFPPAVDESLDGLGDAIYPDLFAKLIREKRTEAMYKLVRSKPDLLINASRAST